MVAQRLCQPEHRVELGAEHPQGFANRATGHVFDPLTMPGWLCMRHQRRTLRLDIAPSQQWQTRELDRIDGARRVDPGHAETIAIERHRLRGVCKDFTQLIELPGFQLFARPPLALLQLILHAKQCGTFWRRMPGHLTPGTVLLSS
jgi:hypothetical protein